LYGRGNAVFEVGFVHNEDIVKGHVTGNTGIAGVSEANRAVHVASIGEMEDGGAGAAVMFGTEAANKRAVRGSLPIRFRFYPAPNSRPPGIVKRCTAPQKGFKPAMIRTLLD
jgi:hypothetical protein